jgi:hypothetical protein
MLKALIVSYVSSRAKERRCGCEVVFNTISSHFLVTDTLVGGVALVKPRALSVRMLVHIPWGYFIAHGEHATEKSHQSRVC